MRKSVIIAGLAAAATLTAGGVALAAQQEPTGSPSSATSAPAVPRDQAEKTALAKVPGGKVTSAELDDEHGKQVWDFDITGTDGVEHEITVDASSGAVVTNKAGDANDANDTDTDDTGLEDGGSTATSAPAVARDQAEKTALAKVPGGKVTSAELDDEHGKQVWDFDITGTDGAEHEITVDASSGAVVTNQTGDTDTDDTDDANDTDTDTD
ncbi:PepSY domain-containing protein [Sphaerisporangium dianthi]|uniref:PepSY domain-containing protein n=1 Tax=Sphaerisporangium dianthi TaxID=1436120 RepID=A0ABV9CQR7_9ACTN